MQTRNGLGIKVASMYAKQELNTHTRACVRGKKQTVQHHPSNPITQCDKKMYWRLRYF